jgi:molybdenum cofactor guanylyltransferase
MSEVSALILAGGRATRFGGIAKHEIVVEGRTIFERQVAVLAPRVAEIIVSSAQPIAGYRTVADAVSDGGPLAGIAAGLAAASTPWLLVVAGDMPYITPSVVDLLVTASTSPSPSRSTTTAPDAIAFSIGGLPEPLFCLLRREPAAAAVATLVSRGDRKASRLLTDVGLRLAWIDETALREVDPDLRALQNINAPSDLG